MFQSKRNNQNHCACLGVGRIKRLYVGVPLENTYKSVWSSLNFKIKN